MIAGVITITGPKGQTVLDETFDVPSTEAEAESNFVTYGNVWESSGAYDISVELTNRQVGNAAQTDATVTITDTAKDKLAVAIGFDGADDPIDIRVGQSLSEILKEEQTPQ